MNNWEFWDLWWQDTAVDKKETEQFVASWRSRVKEQVAT